MNSLLNTIITAVISIFSREYGVALSQENIQLQPTRKEFSGDITLVVFPLLKYSKTGPGQTAEKIGSCLTKDCDQIIEFNTVKGFLNLRINPAYWAELLVRINDSDNYGFNEFPEKKGRIVIEYSSPNTNKPLHLGHIRNNLLGYSLSKITLANGHDVSKVNIVNDRGIHICKSMLAWQKWGKGKTPEASGMKGDHLVGDFYVMFDQEYKKQVAGLKEQGMEENLALKEAEIIKEAQDMLRKWEAEDPGVREIWKMMNDWVEEGFDETYKRLGVDFDKIYYESDTYKLGRDIILQGVAKGILRKKEDGSVWADLTGDGLDEKLLLRSDGTSVYMTQDVGLARQRYEEYHFDRHIYVVGNEQNYHFQVLQLVLKKLGFDWADQLYHLSYGMVELPHGKMKSREGTVVDADDLLDEMTATARRMSEELGKLEDFDEDEKEEIVRRIGLGALKYFILKVDPKKNMVFDPVESVDFNGNTGPFIQYTYARIRSVMRKAEEKGASAGLDKDLMPMDKEIELIKLLARFPEVIRFSLDELNPALIANYIYDLTREYNQFYHDHSILNAETVSSTDFRLMLSENIGKVIKTALDLLGIEVPERM